MDAWIETNYTIASQLTLINFKFCRVLIGAWIETWTTFFFGLFVPLIRGDIKWAVILTVLSLIIGGFTFGIGAIIVNIVFSFVYNKIYIKNVMERGFVPNFKKLVHS